jgi:hypothetical protein
LLKEGEVRGDRRDARVVTFDGNSFFACGDYAGAPVYGPGNSVAQQLGLNIPAVATALRRVAFPEDVCGGGHIRWPKRLNRPLGLEPPFGVLVLMKQTFRMEQAVWSEGPVVLRCFIIRSNGDTAAVDGTERAALLQGLFKGTVRTKPDEADDLIKEIEKRERSLIDNLKRITREEFDEGVRYAVMPLFAGVVSAPLRD